MKITDNNSQKVNKVPEVGILEWFHLNDTEHVKRAVLQIKQLGIKHLRTGISWADFHTDGGKDWYNWLIPFLAQEFEILPCFLYTPPSLGITNKTSSPPKDPKAFADFLDVFIGQYGEYFEYVELWNEPNNRSEYDYLLDPQWQTFSQMISMASYWAKHLGKKTVLGGMSPIDPNWLNMLAANNILEYVDVIGIHGFPNVFESRWECWQNHVDQVNAVLNKHNLEKEIWITETGYSTWRHDQQQQIINLLEVMQAPVTRFYWYSLYDLPENRPTIDGFHYDDREYHFGMITADGTEKLLYRLWVGGIENIKNSQWFFNPTDNNPTDINNHILITGGAGFIGTHVAHRLMREGYTVTVYDNLSRKGVEENLRWLHSEFPHQLTIMIADVRDYYTLQKAVANASHVFHFAAQVAVTSSLENPVYDFEVNVKGTLNLLEIIRKSYHKPSLIYSSTNKVYGNLADVRIKKNSTRYYPEDPALEEAGISEQRNLDFHSPYGSSKGSADQYVIDYTRSFGLKNIVFRMSCIYGPHQYGTEDQGWVAHFILNALKKQPITLYGTGMQVRDILFIDDLVNAFMKAWHHIDTLSGQAFNIGGGPSNAVSLIELIRMIEDMENDQVKVILKDWRKGDQPYYVSDTSRFIKSTGWKPQVAFGEGVRILHSWLKEHYTEIQKVQSSYFHATH
jgi:CDP-paratose 2-epimerase